MQPNSKVKIIAAVLAGVALLTVLGLVASVAIPGFLKNRYKSRQGEVKYTLKVLLTKQQEFRRANGQWATEPRQLVEYVNSAPRNCTCFFADRGWGGKGDVKFALLPAAVQQRLRANTGAAEDLVIACAVNLDEDDAPDVWTISAGDPTPRIDFADLGE